MLTIHYYNKSLFTNVLKFWHYHIFFQAGLLFLMSIVMQVMIFSSANERVHILLTAFEIKGLSTT